MLKQTTHTHEGESATTHNYIYKIQCYIDTHAIYNSIYTIYIYNLIAYTHIHNYIYTIYIYKYIIYKYTQFHIHNIHTQYTDTIYMQY